MSKELSYVNVICQVTHNGNWIGGRDVPGMVKSAEALAAEIKKHCDYYEGHEIQSVYVCSFCGHDWETDKDGIPICCGRAEKEELSHKSAEWVSEHWDKKS